jgi:hypothetical protein
MFTNSLLRIYAKISCHRNIFTKMVPFPHVAGDKFYFFVVNLRKSQHLLKINENIRNFRIFLQVILEKL